jgi:Zn-dependent protease with chaperone function
MGLPSITALILIGFSVVRTRRRLSLPPDGDVPAGNLQVLPTPEPAAYAVPGRPGYIVISVGMLRALPAAERRVLLAHERSHLERGHHRYLRVVELAAAAAPVLACLKHQVRHATERWADEDAANHVGDRGLVARALARATLAGTDYARAGAMGLVGGSVPARIEAMLGEPATRSVVWKASMMSLSGLTAALATSTVQLHHLLAFTNHVCPV